MSSTTILILIAIGVAVCCVITATGFVLHNVILIRAVQRNTSWTVPARDCCDTWRGCYEGCCDDDYDDDDENLGCCEREKHICLCFGIYECLRPGHKEAVAAEAKVKSERIAARTAANNADGHITITRTSSVNPLSFLAGAIRDDVNELTEPLRYITARAPIIKVRKVKDIAPPAPQAQEQARGVVGGDGAVEDDGAAATEGATVGHPTSDWTRHWHDDHAAYYWQHTDTDGQGTHESQWTEPTSEETAAQNTLAGKDAAVGEVAAVTVGHPTADWTRHWHDDHAANYWQHTDADGQGTHESQWTEPTSEETAVQNTLAGKDAAVPPADDSEFHAPGEVRELQRPTSLSSGKEIHATGHV